MIVLGMMERREVVRSLDALVLPTNKDLVFLARRMRNRESVVNETPFFLKAHLWLHLSLERPQTRQR